MIDKIKDALIEIDFVKRYEEVSNKFNAGRTFSSDRLKYINCKEIMKIIEELGYYPVYDSKEKFYKIKEEQIGHITFGVHIILRYGGVELVWVVRENEQLLLGSPWSTYSKRIIDENYRIKKPFIATYDDLEEILRITFKMYEDFKKALCGKLKM